jgi:prepilin-type N-terminal cleavage/methylation domain-containing protein
MKTPETTSRSKTGQASAEANAFTLIELLVVIIIIALLAAMLLPVLANAKLRATGTKCMSNEKQIIYAYKMYVDDYQGRLPYDVQGGGSPNWIAGSEDYNGSAGDTDTTDLTDSSKAQLGPYVLKQAAIFRCPADKSCQFGTAGLPRIRSISMNQAIGYNGAGNTSGCGGWLPSEVSNYGHSGGTTLYKVYFKESDVTRPSPSKLFVFADEDPDTINDASWAVQEPYGTTTIWVDMPSKLHGSSEGLSFMDGHAEIHGWVNPQAIDTTIYSTAFTEAPQINNNVDLFWIGVRASAPADGSDYPFPNNY